MGLAAAAFKLLLNHTNFAQLRERTSFTRITMKNIKLKLPAILISHVSVQQTSLVFHSTEK
jgi:hypothetical protein